MVMVHPNQQTEFVLYNPYAINIDRGNKNCYNYRRFECLVRNCRVRGIGGKIGKERRLEYRNKNIEQSNLNKKEDLIILN